MPARLFCKTGELTGTEHRIAREATIGRLSQNEITLYPVVISGRHARIFYDDQQLAYFLEDLGSSNGTSLDGIAVTEPVRLGALHVITFADEIDFIFQELSTRPRTPDAREDTDMLEKTQYGDVFTPLPDLPPSPAADAPPDASQAQEASGERTRFGDDFLPLPPIAAQPPPDDETRLDVPPPEQEDDDGAETVMLDQPPTGREAFALDVRMPEIEEAAFALQEGENVVGRESGVDVVLRDPSVSRRHALLTVREGRVTVRDLGSKNATFVNGLRIADDVEVSPGATIRFGLEVEATLRKA